MKEVELRVRPQGRTLGDFYNDRSRVSLVMGPLGSGKTITACQKLLKLMTEQEANPQGVRPSRWLAIRNSYPDLQNTTIIDWIGLFGDLGPFTGCNSK